MDRSKILIIFLSILFFSIFILEDVIAGNLVCGTGSTGSCPASSTVCTGASTCTFPSCNCIVTSSQTIDSGATYILNNLTVNSGITITVNYGTARSSTAGDCTATGAGASGSGAGGGAGGGGASGTGAGGAGGSNAGGGGGGSATTFCGAGVGAGGAGGSNSGSGGACGHPSSGGYGGGGGGLVTIRAINVTVAGTIATSGEGGGTSISNTACGGGGGGGGNIKVGAHNFNNSGTLSAGGASGAGNGGGGGGGTITINYTNASTGGTLSVGGGAGGTGATAGATGITGNSLYRFNITLNEPSHSGTSPATANLNYTPSSPSSSSYTCHLYFDGSYDSNQTATNGTKNTFTKSGLTSGSAHNWTITCFDTIAGTQSLTFNFSVGDTTPPTITVRQPTNTTTTGLTFWGNISLNEDGNTNSGLYSLDGAANQTLTSQNATFFYKQITSTRGPHSIVFYANDTANNTGVSSTVFFTLDTKLIKIRGKAFDSLNGRTIGPGNLTAIIKETGEKINGNITNGDFDLSFSPTAALPDINRINIGLFLNTSDERIGYSSIQIGREVFQTITQTCTRKLWHFRGLAYEIENATAMSSGSVTVGIREKPESNSTIFTNGVWEIYLNPCLISGEKVTFQFLITDRNNTKRSFAYLNQIAK